MWGVTGNRSFSGSLKQNNGGYRFHDNGKVEISIREKRVEMPFVARWNF